MEEVPVAAGRQVSGIQINLAFAGGAFAFDLANSLAGGGEELELYRLCFRDREADGGDNQQ